VGRFVERAQALALAFGAPGLFVVAFLDSSILSLPEIADLLIIWMVIQHKSRLVLYAASATVGSIIGCLALYYLGLKGGDALIRKRFHPASVDRTLAQFQRYGTMAVLIPSLLPPPAPFKIFVLLAGVADIRVGQFVTAIAIGRGIRYFGEGLLAVWYGERAITFLRENGTRVSLILVALLAVAFAAYLLWGRKRAADAR
jgi:membrane protein YqaA with SNARE-associated domain